MLLQSATFGVLGLALGALANPTPIEAALEIRQTADAPCTTGVHMMIAGGCGTTCPNDDPGLLNSIIASITSSIPGSDQYIVPYDGSTNQGRVSTPIMIQAATNYASTCPNSPIVFLGYSLGGIIVMNTLCGGISTRLQSSVIAAIAYGEETYIGGQPYDYGTCTANAPLYPRANTASCQAYASILRSYCDVADPQCCTGGTNQQVHYSYARKYDADALAFIVAQFKARGGTIQPICPPPLPRLFGPLSSVGDYFKALGVCLRGGN